MCGISGFIKKGAPTTALTLTNMNDAIRHRGPDDEGYVCLAQSERLQSYSGSQSTPMIKNRLPLLPLDLSVSSGMSFCRLSILDLSDRGHQPMLNDSGNVAITFNGEIYNYRELRAELIGEGFTFNSETDTEVILKGYECWGKEIVNKLNGMFAFSLLDNNKGILWLVRDRLGIKPLFYHQSESDITWASEIKSILKATWVVPEINWEGLEANYYLLTTPPPSTCFKNIFSVQPGTWREVQLDSLEAKEDIYWKIPFGSTTTDISLEEAASELDTRLKHIVNLQSRADVPLISLMSGGIDSTTLSALFSDLYPSFQCYSMGFDGTGKGVDELPQAISIAKKLGIRQKVHIVKPEEVLDHLESDIAHFEEPYSALEANLTAAKYLNQEGIKVAINGNGADEVFGGYMYYLKILLWHRRQKWSWIQPLIPSSGEFFKKIKNYLLLDTAGKYFAHTRQSMHYYHLKELFLGTKNDGISPLGHWVCQGDKPFRNMEEAFFFYDLKYSVSAHHVFRDDLSSMRYGLEMRYPYLDHTLIEWVSSLPLSIRYNSKINKPLLRKTASAYIAEGNLSMPKKGFSFPFDKWMQENPEIQNYALQQLTSLKERGMFNNKAIDNWWKSRKTGYDYLKIWQLVTTEVWLRNYID